MTQEKKYVVMRNYGRTQSKPHIFDDLESAVKCAEKMNKTGKTRAEIEYGYPEDNGYTIRQSKKIDY